MLVVLVLCYFKSHRSSPALSSCKCCCCFFYSCRVFDRLFLHITAHNCYTTLCSDLPLYGIKNQQVTTCYATYTFRKIILKLSNLANKKEKDTLLFNNHEPRNLVLHVEEEKYMKRNIKINSILHWYKVNLADKNTKTSHNSMCFCLLV